MQCSVPKIDMLTLGRGSLRDCVLVNQSLVGEGIREALKEGND